MCTYMLFNHCIHTASHVNERLRSQALKWNLVLFVMLDALQVPPLPSPHWFLGAYTVEVRSLHTLKLESLNLVFQPLHNSHVNKL